MSTVEDPKQDLSSSYNYNFNKEGMSNVFQGNFITNNLNDLDQNEIPLNAEDTYNEDDFENEGLGLVMDVRSTTFRDLAGMIPRGYGEMGDITKKEEEIVINEHANFDIANSSSPSHDPLEEMKIRNQEKWAQLGYDPKAGRGNMKMSITLSNFKPSAILQNSTISSNNSNNGKTGLNSSNETKTNEFNKNLSSNQTQQQLLSSLPENKENGGSTVSTQVLQSYSMCIKPNKQIKRVNSSNDPSKFIEAQSNSDESDDSEHNDSEDDDLIPAVKLNTAALIASFQPLEEDLQNPDQHEIINGFDNNIHDNSELEWDNTESDDSSSELASDSQTLESNSNNDNNNDKEENNITFANASKCKKTKNAKIFKPSSPHSANSSSTTITINEGNGSSEDKNTNSSMNNKDIKTNKKTRKSSKCQSQTNYDYSAYDDPNFDYDTALKNVPPDLLKLIKYPKTGIVFRAICGQSISQYPRDILQYVIADLKTLLDKCISKNMVTESAYISEIIDSIKTEIDNDVSYKKMKYEERCMDAEESLSKKQQYWATQKIILNSEKEVKLQEIELRYQDELENLEILWNSDKKRAQFNKPSAQLIALRQNVQTNLAAKRFHEAAQLATKAEILDRKETELASQKMRQAYSEAAERLKQKFENERETFLQQFEGKKTTLLAQEEADLRPIENRIQKYNNNNNNQQSNQFDHSSSTTQDTASIATRRSISVMSKQSGPVIKKPIIKAPKMPTQTNAKLKLPLLKPNPQPIYKGSTASATLP